jgi:hypothetical protein
MKTIIFDLVTTVERKAFAEGAAHFTREKGVIPLLQKAEYMVQPITN